ncbi:MBL fold metallo-hydrolase [Azospirillum sp. RWY-5-1]|uniref:MBL fold metallo-hydrolase n=1 Tax=Azospirillum oleiclasticum TaxID=2735135 RepID=A0ABX2T766_9PROT|nr:MBL fold metallo-hydrolase [Azospirillum oleiclasticum]NYZ11608.1 MBL fold metallo-hydrolase [Azospirillum oleiclasticum]NYZ18769.1 MBL fold metallo-hydrolase [Azospirillum oleiclasticum]
MRVCIHRGAKQIGGTCIEIEAGSRRIAFDICLPLDAADDTASMLPAVPGFRDPDDSLLAVVISHPHQDHYGLARHLRPDLPIMIGGAADRILKAAACFIRSGVSFQNLIPLRDRRVVEIGPFRVLPLLVDHSAYDAYSLLAEADGKRLFYTGDFRVHGRKAALVERLIEHPPAGVDVLLMEGSSIGRLDEDDSFPTEDDLEHEFVDAMHATKGTVLVYASGQNIDRLVTVFRACRKTGRQLVIDLYTAEVLRATGNDRIPQGWWSGVRVFLPHRQRVWAKRNELFDLVPRYRANRIDPEELASAASTTTALFRPSLCEDLDRANCLAGASVIYSMWSGYLRDERSEPFLKWLDRHCLPMVKVHTSGHASVRGLKRLADAIRPRRLVPVHSFSPDRYSDYFDNVDIRGDGEWWEV